MSIPVILLILTIVAIFPCLFVIFKKNGIAPWKALIPIYNFFAWAKMLDRSFWWGIMMLLPGVNFYMFAVYMVETANAFGKRKFTDHLLAVIFPFAYLPYLAFKELDNYQGPIDWKATKKTKLQEWGHSIVYAVIAASFIRALFFEAFMIPTGSMERSLRVGDYLFVSKLAYGSKLPETLLNVPFTHHTVPGVNTKAFLDWYQLPYTRLPGLRDVERMDAVVFNFPKGDTVWLPNQAQDFEQNARDETMKRLRRGTFTQEEYLATKKMMLNKTDQWTVRPRDKKEFYVKRCIGLPGETIEIKNTEVFIDGKKIEEPEGMNHDYVLITKNPLNLRIWKEKYDIGQSEVMQGQGGNIYQMPMTVEVYNQVKSLPIIDTIFKVNNEKGASLKEGMRIFPNHRDYDWSEDNFGPMYIPKAGESIEINTENLPLYHRIISNYEGNELLVKDGSIFINGEQVDSYTFKQDYYWMMGDNRHRSADSRFWGFVPEDHIVGTPAFIWFSKDAETGIRWNRIFSIPD